MNTRILLTLGLAALIALPASLAVFHQFQDKTSAIVAEDANGLQASLKGMEPGTSVSYKILSPDGEALSGTQVTARDGTLNVPVYKFSPAAHAPVSYNLEIENAAGPINVHFKIDPQDGRTFIEGKGLKKFSDVIIESEASQIKTRADWSGLVRELDAAGLASSNNDKDKSQGLRVALFNNDVMNDANIGSPLVIEVQMSAGNAKVVNSYVRGLQLMTAQLSAVMMQQAQIIGSFIDAKTQLRTQRELQTLQAEAHKDYQTSDQMCRFGSFVKNIGRAEIKADHDKMALNSILMATYLNRKNGNTSESFAKEMDIRLKQFREVYCDPMDNNNGLRGMCDHDGEGPGTDIGGVDKQRFNKDIDFPRTIGSPLTLATDFTDSPAAATADEEDVIALAKNLYWPRSFNLAQPASGLSDNPDAYMDSRHMIAMMNVAHNSFANIVSMKGASVPTATSDNSGPAFMKSLMREFGLTDPDIESMLGANPSYYAQMEVLTKKIYQHPNFYTNLYDKPTNVKRIGASMDAIKLMQDRDEFESALRREMLLSMMVEDALGEGVKALNDTLVDTIKIPE